MSQQDQRRSVTSTALGLRFENPLTAVSPERNWPGVRRRLPEQTDPGPRMVTQSGSK